MYLKSLLIESAQGKVREISFKRGLNLIVDQTTDAPIDSGNNVGKTTFLRVVDYCLGGKKSDIYRDREFKRDNKKVLEVFTRDSFVFHLVLENEEGKESHVIRPFKGKSSIDGQLYMNDRDFQNALKVILFGHDGARPTLGQLMNKFIRVEDYQLSNTLYFLHSAADLSEYEAVFLFLFGFRETDLLSRKRALVDMEKEVSRAFKASEFSVADLQQQLHLIEIEITGLEKLKKTFNFSPSVQEDLRELGHLQREASKLKSEIAQLDLKASLNDLYLRKLSKAKANLDATTIRRVYEEASLQLPTLQRRFEEALEFHNRMTENKSKFINGKLAEIQAQRKASNDMLNLLIQREQERVRHVSDAGDLAEYDNISSKLQERYREKGNREGAIESLTRLCGKLQDVNNQLKNINGRIEEFRSSLDENIRRFNEYFSEYSRLLYDERYYLAPKIGANEWTENLLLDIGNLNENVGTGKKKAQISSFDLAYLRYAEECDWDVPRFVLHDQLEVVHENQIKTLFTISNSLQGQFVVAVLRDKLRLVGDDIIKSCAILTLSQGDKLFRV